MLFLSETDVERLLDHKALIAAIEEAFVELAQGRIVHPHELRIDDFERPGNYVAFPVYLPHRDAYAVKVLAAVDGNRTKGEPFIHALVVLVNAANGRPQAVIEAGYLTACRTAAATAVATRHLAQPGRRCFGMIGTGVQGRSHVEIVPLLGGFERVLIHSPSGAYERAEALAEQARARHGVEAHACRDIAELLLMADVVTVATLAREPLFDAALLRRDAHLNVVGTFRPSLCQVATELLAHAGAIVTDDVSRFRAHWQPAIGDVVSEADLDRIEGLAQLVRASRSGRAVGPMPGPTLFFSGGMALEDAVAATLVDAAARSSATTEAAESEGRPDAPDA